MARLLAAVASSTTTHWPMAPWPVRANWKSAGAAPTVIWSIAIMIAPGCERAGGVAQASTQAATMPSMRTRMVGRLPSMRNRLDRSSVAQFLDDDRLTGRLQVPEHAGLYWLLAGAATPLTAC